MNTTTETPEVTEADKITAKFDAQKARFAEREAELANLRAFFTKHCEALAPWDWQCYAFGSEIKFDVLYGPDKGKQKDIARAFGADGWTRHSNSSSCGQIDWRKTVDGVELTIEGAENLRRELITEVKL